MTERQGFEQIQVSLTETIEKWIEDNCDTEPWEAVSIWSSDDLALFMSRAAMAVLESHKALEHFLIKQGQLK